MAVYTKISKREISYINKKFKIDRIKSFKGIKQDTRMERPSASNQPEWLPFDTPSDGYGRDWVPVGDVELRLKIQ